MSRRRNENLSNESEEIQNAVLDELVNNDVKSEETLEDNKINNINENEKEQEVKPELNEVQTEVPEIIVGSRVKINNEIGHDMLGKRIHNGVKNYVYTVKAVRPDDYCTIECLACQFTLAKSDLSLQ